MAKKSELEDRTRPLQSLDLFSLVSAAAVRLPPFRTSKNNVHAR
jgi:hypothetical protein